MTTVQFYNFPFLKLQNEQGLVHLKLKLHGQSRTLCQIAETSEKTRVAAKKESGGPRGDRTHDLRVISTTLYRLS